MRIRTVKPEFWTHPVTGRWRGELQAFAISLLNAADDEGFFWADASAVRSAVRPFDEDSTNVRRMLDECSRAEWVTVAKHPSRGLIGRIPTFLKHQRIDRPRPSEIARYFKESEVLPLDDDSTIDRRALDDDSLQEGKGRDGKGREESAPSTKEQRGLLMADFKDIIGSDYDWQGVKDNAALKALLQKHPIEEIRARWQRGLRVATGWHAVRGVAQLRSKWNDLTGGGKTSDVGTGFVNSVTEGF